MADNESSGPRRRRWPLILLGAVVAAVVLVVGGTAFYINVIREDAPEEFTLDRPAAALPVSDEPVDGVWTVGEGSQAGYRVDEVLFGQNVTAAGRTSDITGEMTIEGTSVTAAEFTVQMATVTSDESRRDNQFRNRIMDVRNYPTSTFRLTEPIDLGTIPTDEATREYQATGDLTLRGTTREVTMTLQARRSGDKIEVVGQLPIVFADYNIPNPSIPGISTEDNGIMEVSLVLERAEKIE